MEEVGGDDEENGDDVSVSGGRTMTETEEENIRDFIEAIPKGEEDVTGFSPTTLLRSSLPGSSENDPAHAQNNGKCY